MERGYDPADFRSVLFYMKNRFGVEVFREPQRISAILRDLSPKLDADINVLRQLSDRGLLAELESVSGAGELRQRQAVMKLYACLTDYLQLPEDRAEFYAVILLDLYGVPSPLPRRPSAPTRPTSSGRTGNLLWTIGGDGLLTVSGVGEIPDYPFSSERVDSPWWGRRTEIDAVRVSDGVTAVGASAFYGCRNLKRVTLPDSVTRIGEWAFADCASLERVTLSAALRRIDRGAFSDCKALTEIDIPSAVGSIESWTFCNCVRLRRVTVPDGLSAIGQRAFQNCPLLAHVQIPAVAWVEDTAFDASAVLTRRTPPVPPPPVDTPPPAPPDEPSVDAEAVDDAISLPAWVSARALQTFLLLLFALTVILCHGLLTLLLLFVPVGLLLLWERG